MFFEGVSSSHGRSDQKDVVLSNQTETSWIFQLVDLLNLKRFANTVARILLQGLPLMVLNQRTGRDVNLHQLNLSFNPRDGWCMLVLVFPKGWRLLRRCWSNRMFSNFDLKYVNATNATPTKKK